MINRRYILPALFAALAPILLITGPNRSVGAIHESPLSATAPQAPPEQAIFPGQADPKVSAAIITTYNHALRREYKEARGILMKLGHDLPNDPAGPTGEMVLYQVMMLENDDYEMDAEFRDAARRAEAASIRFAQTAPKNDWYYTILGASWGIQGIYYLRRDEYLNAAMPGLRGLYLMQTAAKMNPENWEARMGIGLFLYYRSAYASLVPGPWLDQRKKGIAEVEVAGKRRQYLSEVSRIALFYIYVNERQYDRALSYMAELIAERPYYVIFYQLAGRAMMVKGDLAAAHNYYKKMNEIDPALYFPYFILGKISMEMGKNDEARKWFTQFFAVLGNRKSSHRKPAEKYMKELGTR